MGSIKSRDPTTKSDDTTVTSCGKQVRQLAGCIGCAKGFITSFPFSPTVPSPLPSGQRGYRINPGDTRLYLYLLLESEALQITNPSFIRLALTNTNIHMHKQILTSSDAASAVLPLTTVPEG